MLGGRKEGIKVYNNCNTLGAYNFFIPKGYFINFLLSWMLFRLPIAVEQIAPKL